jgi:hypothetical protein
MWDIRKYPAGFVLFLAFFGMHWCEATTERPPPVSLSLTERNSLRYNLENTFNEVDLLIRNHKADLTDLKRQERDMNALKVFDRIPFQRDIPGLKRELKKSSQPWKIQIRQVEVTHYSKPASAAPGLQTTDAPLYRLKPEQVAETIFLKLSVKGEEEPVKKWVSSWRTDQMRLVELDLNHSSEINSQVMRKTGPDIWELRIRTFRFRSIAYPVLSPRNPRELLPSWAKKNTDLFSSSEPILWSFVTRIEALAPKARPYYKNRAHFLLNDARMNFFLSKASP